MIYVVVMTEEEWLDVTDEMYSSTHLVHAYPTKEMAENAIKELGKANNAEFDSDHANNIVAFYEVGKTECNLHIWECPFN